MLYKLSLNTLMGIAGAGGLFVGTFGYVGQYIHRGKVKEAEFYRASLMLLRSNKAAKYLLGSPIDDGRIKYTNENNVCNSEMAHLEVPVYGRKDSGMYYFWAENKNGVWLITRAELSVEKHPDKMLAVLREPVSATDIFEKKTTTDSEVTVKNITQIIENAKIGPEVVETVVN